MTSGNVSNLIIVTPVYEDIEAANMLFNDLRRAFGPKIYVVVIDDGSVHNPVDISCLQDAGLGGVVIRLKRNVGHQKAIAVGLNYVAHELSEDRQVVIMDSDGEDLPASISELLFSLDYSDVDMVVAERKRRFEALGFRVFYVFYKLFFKILSGRSISFGNFMALKPIAVKRMAAMQELWIHVAACSLNSKLRIATCPLDKGRRYAGKSKMNFVSLALHGFRGLMVFSEDVLVRVGIACTFVATLSILGGAIAIGLKLFHYATPGWFSVVLGILLLVFLQTGALTLMSLMLTGVVRGGLMTNVAYLEFVYSLTHAHDPLSD